MEFTGDLETPVRTGYLFEGYQTSDGKEYELEEALDEEIYYANWQPITYYVTYYNACEQEVSEDCQEEFQKESQEESILESLADSTLEATKACLESDVIPKELIMEGDSDSSGDASYGLREEYNLQEAYDQQELGTYTYGDILATDILYYDQSYPVREASDFNLSKEGYHLLWMKEDGTLLTPGEATLLNETCIPGDVVRLSAYWEKNPTISYETSDYEGVYDRQAHSASVMAITEGCTITYSSDGLYYSSIKPSYINAGNYKTYFRITHPDYPTIEDCVSVTIEKAKSTIQLSVADGYIGVNTNNTDAFQVITSSSNPSIASFPYNERGDGSNRSIPTHPIRVVPTALGGSGDLICTAYIAESDNYLASDEATMGVYVGPELNTNSNCSYGSKYQFTTYQGWYADYDYDGAFDKNLNWIAYQYDQWMVTMPITLSAGTYYVENFTGASPRDVCWKGFSKSSGAYCIFSANGGYTLTADTTRYVSLTIYNSNVYQGTTAYYKVSPAYFATHRDNSGKYASVKKVRVYAIS